MSISKKDLEVKRSTIPGAGNGLFTKVFIPKQTLILEYTGIVTTWDKVKDEHHNNYIYYISAEHVINAEPVKDSLARYANDAKGLTVLPGIKNNCSYKRFGTRVFVKALRDIPAGSEILVGYGKQYWDTARHNKEVDRQLKAKPGRRPEPQGSRRRG